MLAAAKQRRQRDWLMFLVAYWHGLKPSEATGFQKNAIKDGQLTVVRANGTLTRQRLVEDREPLLNEKQPLIDYLAAAPPDRPAFPVSREHFWNLFRQYARAAGTPPNKWHPHVLRATVAIEIGECAGIDAAQQHLGLNSFSAVMAYFK